MSVYCTLVGMTHKQILYRLLSTRERPLDLTLCYQYHPNYLHVPHAPQPPFLSFPPSVSLFYRSDTYSHSTLVAATDSHHPVPSAENCSAFVWFGPVLSAR